MAKVKKNTAKKAKISPETKPDSAVENVPREFSIKSEEKIPSAATLALDVKEQRVVSKQAKKLIKGLESGKITLKPDRKSLKQKAEEKRGLMYIGHLPHGFFEEEMKNYFKQFGRVTNVKVCRSNKTGKSKGYGYIEFDHPEVAKIAADSMNNYLMFKKRIVTKFVPYEERPLHLFHGKSSNEKNTSVKNRRGKQKHSRNTAKDEAIIEKKNKLSLKKLQNKMEKLNSRGIQCVLTPVGLDDNIKLEKPSSSHVTRSKSTTLPSLSTPSSLHLSKSLDSVQKLLKKKSSQDSETQTGAKIKKVKQGGVIKVKKEKKGRKEMSGLAKLDKNAIKSIARDLVRKQGSPLLKLKSKKMKK